LAENVIFMKNIFWEVIFQENNNIFLCLTKNWKWTKKYLLSFGEKNLIWLKIANVNVGNLMWHRHANMDSFFFKLKKLKNLYNFYFIFPSSTNGQRDKWGLTSPASSKLELEPRQPQESSTSARLARAYSWLLTIAKT